MGHGMTWYVGHGYNSLYGIALCIVCVMYLDLDMAWHGMAFHGTRRRKKIDEDALLSFDFLFSQCQFNVDTII